MTDLHEFDADFVDLADKVFERAALAEAGASGLAKQWSQVYELAMASLTSPEASGGSAASWFEAYVLHRAAAYHAVNLPLVEHDLLGGWLLGQLGGQIDARIVAVGWPVDGFSGQIDVPWGRVADRLLTLEPIDGGKIKVVEREQSDVDMTARENLAGMPRDRMSVIDAGIELGVLDGHATRVLRLRGALARSIQLVGTLERCVDIAADHARMRHQFGRPLMAFQAVQTLVADAAAETAVARAATIGAVRAAEAAGEDLAGAGLSIAIAKSCASHAVGPVTRNAHQVLGAIGTTQEHELHRFTVPALAWRQEFGTAAHWDRELAVSIAARGVESIWRSVLDADTAS